jgi:hypothetical protein
MVVDRRRAALALAATAAAVAVGTLDTTILNPAVPTIRHDLHTTVASLQWARLATLSARFQGAPRAKAFALWRLRRHRRRTLA